MHEYIKQKMNSGIYIWKNSINNKVYIGATTNFKKRKQEHIRKSINGSQYEIHKAINEIGIDNFQFEILEYVNESYLAEREKFWIKKYDSINTGYNTLDGYNSISFNPNLEKIKDKIRKKASSRKWIKKGGTQKSVYTAEIDLYLKEGWELGRIPFSEEHLDQLSKSHIGIGLSEESRKKCGDIWRGRTHSEKTRQLMSKKTKGRYSLEWYIKKYGDEIGRKKYESHQYKLQKGRNGRVWINKNGKTKQIDKIDYEKFISDGWNRGRK